ncbi:MAG TPA: hypothetical protein VF212_10935 [Longimicrobiales bacterium]
MSDPRPHPDAHGDVEAAALAALERFRRRARDGGQDHGVDCLIRRAHAVEDEAGRHRRRSELIDRAVEEDDVDADLAAEVYDLAREEGIEPAFAFELLRCGVAVRDIGGEAPEATYTVRGYPNWIQALPAEQARRERMLRTSFRRLRALLERSDSAEDALIAFAREPDVGEVDYE